MMNRKLRNMGGSWPRAVGAAALALALVPVPLAAQSVSDYRLPGAETPRPDVAGPVDPDNPVVRGPAPRPSAAQPPTPAATTPSPSPQPATSPSASPQPRAVQPRPLQTTARPAAASAPLATPAVGPATAPVLPPLPPSPGAAPSPFPAALPDVAAAPAASPAVAPGDWPRLWIGGGVALLLTALGALLWWRRRRSPLDLELEFEPPVVAAPKPAAEPVPQPAPLPVAANPEGGLGIALEARRMNASLMATTLSYNLKLTNHSAEPLSALAIEGDMVAAHASLPPERQIASSGQRLELRHALVALAPGESAEFSGDFRLLLTAITPIRSGEAAFFVPLARLRVEASTPSGGPLVHAQTFVVGELPEAPGAALRPFRLDLGPRNYARVGQRAVS